MFKNIEKEIYLFSDSTYNRGNWHINSELKNGSVYYWGDNLSLFPKIKFRIAGSVSIANFSYRRVKDCSLIDWCKTEDENASHMKISGLDIKIIFITEAYFLKNLKTTL